MNSFLELVKKRRSVRRFKKDKVLDEHIERILEAGRWAPSASNSQPWEFIVVKDEEKKEKIIKYYIRQRELKREAEMTRDEEFRHYPGVSLQEPGFKSAPVFIVVIGDPRIKSACPLMTYREKGEKHFISSLANAVLLIHLEATELGLGSQYISDISSPYTEAMLKDLLGIPEIYEVYEMIAIGYPDEEPSIPFRRELNEITHREKYEKQKFRDDREIKEFIKNKTQK